jgi:cytoplasmic iron level regulating protein YaaA (DUF328/UPF0246 family)
MKILLPPSEAKNQPTQSRELALNELCFPKDLTVTRTRVLREHKEIDCSRTDFASSIYSGVLYQALDYGSLSISARERADSSIFIFSALFGVLRLDDLIPYYKLKIDPKLWRKPIASSMAGMDDELVVDCRSSTYSTVWTPSIMKSVGIRIFAKVDGQPKVITHMSKSTRGQVTRFLVSQDRTPKTPDELQMILASRFDSRLVAPDGNKGWFINVLL